MNSRISTEYVSIESRRDHELLIVIFLKFYKFPYSFLYYLDATTDEMHKRARHLVQYFCQWKHICFEFSLKKVKQFLTSEFLTSANCGRMNEFFKNRCFVILSISSIPLCMLEIYTYLPFSSLHLLMANESILS